MGSSFLYAELLIPPPAPARATINSPRLINSALSSIESFLQKAYNTTIKVKATLQLNKQQIALRKAAGLKGIQLIFFKPSKPIAQTEFVNQRDSGSRVYVNADSNVDALAVSREVQGATAETVQTGDGVRQTGEASVEGIVNEGEEGYNEGAGDAIDVSLQYKEGWTSEQKAAADAKLKALSQANTVRTPVNRSGTSAKSIYKNAYGNNSIPQGFDIDHKIDLQLGGSNKLENLWPLDQSVNRSLGKQINNFIKNYPIGTIFGKFSIK